MKLGIDIGKPNDGHDDDRELIRWISYVQRIARRLCAMRDDDASAKYGLLDDLDIIGSHLNAIEFGTPGWEARLDGISANLHALEHLLINPN